MALKPIIGVVGDYFSGKVTNTFLYHHKNTNAKRMEKITIYTNDYSVEVSQGVHGLELVVWDGNCNKIIKKETLNIK